jgi:hypothetical protein
MSGWRESLALWIRYLDFHWMFEDTPMRASLFEAAAIRARNIERGLRWLPVYMRRYASMIVMFFGSALMMDSAEAAPAAVGAVATLGIFAVVALVVSTIGFVFLHRATRR